MTLCLKEMNVKNVVFIADKGFYSKKNVSLMKEQELHYIIPLHRNNGLIDFLPLLETNLKKEMKTYFVYQVRIIWYYEYEKESQKIVTFLDENQRCQKLPDTPPNLCERYGGRLDGFLLCPHFETS